MLLKDSHNIFNRSLDQGGVNSRNMIARVLFNFGTLDSFEKSFKTLLPTITIIGESLQEMGFLLGKMISLRNPMSMSS